MKHTSHARGNASQIEGNELPEPLLLTVSGCQADSHFFSSRDGSKSASVNFTRKFIFLKR